MRDSLELLQKMVEDHANSNDLQNHLIELLEFLYKDLELGKQSIASLETSIQTLLKTETFGITSKYAALKESHATLKKQLIQLRDANDDLTIEIIAKGEETKRLLEDQEQEMQVFYVTQIKQKEEELRVAKLNHEEKQRELYNEMQAAEASSAIELDLVESGLRKQLVESNKNLKNSMDTCTILRTELINIKEQFSEYKIVSHQKIAELQKQLRESRQKSTGTISGDLEKCNNGVYNKYHDKSIDLDKSNDIGQQSPKCVDKSMDAGLEKNSNVYSKYQPLEVNYKNFASLDDKTVNYKKPLVYRSSGKFREISKNALPPLIKLSDDKKGTPVGRKRKLFNPDDLSYLHVDKD